MQIVPRATSSLLNKKDQELEVLTFFLIFKLCLMEMFNKKKSGKSSIVQGFFKISFNNEIYTPHFDLVSPPVIKCCQKQ